MIQCKTSLSTYNVSLGIWEEIFEITFGSSKSTISSWTQQFFSGSFHRRYYSLKTIQYLMAGDIIQLSYSICKYKRPQKLGNSNR